MNKFRLIFFLQLVAFLTFSQNQTATNADSVLSAYKLALDSTHGDSVPIVWMQTLMQNASAQIIRLSEKQDINDSLIKKQQNQLAKNKEMADNGDIPSDSLHVALYAGIAIILILLLIFLFMYFKAKRSYNELWDEYGELEETLETIDPGDAEATDKIKAISETFNEMNKKMKVYQNELADSNEKLSFIKVENEKLLEQLDHAQHENQVSATPDQKTIEKIQILENNLATLKTENQRLKQELSENNNTKVNEPPQQVTAYLNLSADAKKQLEEIDLNLAKLERISKMYKSKMISKEEYKELKGTILKKI